jgi:ankyrin repeat protein
MSLSLVPNELLLVIISQIDSEADLASLACTNRTFYNKFIPHLYKRNATYSHGSALAYAVRHGLYSTAQKAVQAGANVNQNMPPIPPSDEHPLINFAAKEGNVRLVELLLDASANITSRDKLRLTPLHLAAAQAHLSTVDLLLRRGADPNALCRSRRTPLYMATLRGHVAVVKRLLAQPTIDVNLPNSSKETPFLGAARLGHLEIALALLECGACASASHPTQSPVHHAVRNKQPELLQKLVNRDDVNVNVLYSDKITPLHHAVYASREDLVRILLTDPRVNPDMTGSASGLTPLLHAARTNQQGIVQRLLDAGANARIMDRTWLSAQMVLEAPSVEARRQLIDEHRLPSPEDIERSINGQTF